MQHVLKVDPEHSLFIVETQGDATVEGILAFLDDIIAHPAWRSGLPILLDHRGLGLHNISAKGVEQVSDYFTSISDVLGDGKLAMVMNRDVDFGIARAWENITMDRTSMRTYVFRGLDEARAWVLLED
jgi:hypothetical protein